MIDTSQLETSNILGATGLPRAVLAAMFRGEGLFGRDSDLTATEQAVLQGRLLPAQEPRTAILPRQTPRLGAVSVLADALIAREPAAVREAVVVAQLAGLSEAAIAEVVTVVDNVRLVFGLPAQGTASAAPALLDRAA